MERCDWTRNALRHSLWFNRPDSTGLSSQNAIVFSSGLTMSGASVAR